MVKGGGRHRVVPSCHAKKRKEQGPKKAIWGKLHSLRAKDD